MFPYDNEHVSKRHKINSCQEFTNSLNSYIDIINDDIYSFVLSAYLPDSDHIHICCH